MENSVGDASSPNIARVDLRTRTVRVAAVFFVLVGLMGWFSLTQASQSTTAVIQLHKLAAEKERLRQENAQLRFEISRLQSISVLRERARKLGFAPPQEAEYLYWRGSQSDDQGSLPTFEFSTVDESQEPSSLERAISHILVLLTAGFSN